MENQKGSNTRKQIGRLALVVYNQRECSGACGFCHGKNHNLRMGVNRKDLENSIRKIDDRTYENAQFDFDKLENLLKDHPRLKEQNFVTIWGADPITSFQTFQECYDFLKYFEKKYDKNIQVHFSTNGLAFCRDDVVEWLLSHKDVRGQLSHDGLGQYFRTFDTDPLNWDSTIELINQRKVSSISCILNQYNALPIDNIEFFRSKHKTVSLRIWTPHLGDYDSIEKNMSGLLNGKNYESLKNVPFGNYMIHNDIEMAEKTGILQLAHQCDDFFFQMEKIIKTWYDTKWDGIRTNLFRRIASSKMIVTDTQNRTLCSQYHHGISDMSDSVDTLGNYTECHLLDSSEKVPNPEWKMPELCEQCPYRHQQECNMCGAMPELKHICQWEYRWKQFCELVEMSGHMQPFFKYASRMGSGSIPDTIEGWNRIVNGNRGSGSGCQQVTGKYQQK